MSLSNNVLSTVPAAARVVATNEKVTGPPGAEMLSMSAIADGSTKHFNVIDNACGGGVLTAELLKLVGSHPGKINVDRIVAIDNDERMIQYISQRKEKSGWTKVEVVKADQQNTLLPGGAFSHIFNNFGIFFCPDDQIALAETHRLLIAGGFAGFTSWKAISWWPEVAVPAMSKFIPGAPELPHPTTLFPRRGWNDPKAIHENLETAGFRNIGVTEFSFNPDVEAGEFAEACAVLVANIAKRAWTEQAYQAYGNLIEPAISRYLKENYDDGKWDGKMVALIAVAKKP